MTRVLLLEPDPWRRLALTAALAQERIMDVAVESDPTRIIGLATARGDLDVDVLGVAHSLIRDYGAGIVSTICSTWKPCKVLVHGDPDADAVAAEALAAGARGYFNMSNPPDLYPRAVKLVSSGKIWGPREAVALMAMAGAAQEGGGDEPRIGHDDREILALLYEGLSNKEIGQRLGLAEATIKARFNKLYKRFGVATRVQLLTSAIRGGLLPDAGRRQSQRI